MKPTSFKAGKVKTNQYPLNPEARQILRAFMLLVWILALAAATALIHPYGIFAEKERKNRQIQKMITDFFPFYANQPWKEVFQTDSRNIYPVLGGLWPAPMFASESFSERLEQGLNFPDRLLGFAFAMPVRHHSNASLFIGFDLHGRVAGFTVLHKNVIHDFDQAPRSSLPSRDIGKTVKSAVVFFNANKQSWIHAAKKE